MTPTRLFPGRDGQALTGLSNWTNVAAFPERIRRFLPAEHQNRFLIFTDDLFSPAVSLTLVRYIISNDLPLFIFVVVQITLKSNS